MKIRNLQAVAILLITALVMTAFAQEAGEGTVDIDMNANAVIQRLNITVAETAPMDFGTLILGNNAGTVEIDAATVAAAPVVAYTSSAVNEFTTTGGAVPTTVGSVSHFDLTSTNTADAAGVGFSITLPASITITATFGAGAGTQTMTVDNFNFAGNPNALTMATPAASVATPVYIGGTLNFAADQATGTYDGSATVTFAYK